VKEFSEFNVFYNGRKKIIPKDNSIFDYFSPLSLAYWFMDDGGIKSLQSKGTILHTQGFTLNEVKYLCKLLKKKYNLNCKPRKQEDRPNFITWQIYISGKSYEILRKLIYNKIHSSMLYKFPTERKKKRGPNKVKILGINNLYNSKHLNVYHLNGDLYKKFTSKIETKKKMEISNYMLNKILKTGEVYNGFIYKGIKNSPF
jgi:LAGLIDADG DNA endonuclease family